ncbi:SCO1-like protein mitochondrial [Chlorella sorokiniana]|uniref:SCO1-like protein mitochondrial n=1 Tax=Chlorella sorokiniana TaxID=3076 RepID=A0A2P6TEU0_CHLSO|nr:SCO1-like protein mitochondrial [Chlorella sorokiniana]|eukprot:PRW32488.1 SCO1-like protein mitochondrial [Chlorella sorokiniana]
MMKVMGVEVPYSYVIGTALAVGLGAYTYEYFQVARELDKQLAQSIMHRPSIRSLSMTDQSGREFTAKQLSGRWALLDTGSLHNDCDVRGINAICRAAEAAQQRTGATITPVFLSTDPRRDKVEDLQRVAGACGHPGLVALTGDADGVMECAHLFKSQQKAQVLAAVTGDEKYKHGDDVMDASYVSSFVYLIAPNGEFAKLWPKDVSIALLSDAVARAVKE